VTSVKEGDFVSAEMHVACGKCLQCRTGQGHICQFVKIIGIDRNGAFADYVVIPESNIWKLDSTIPHEYASILDPLGNAVHTALSGDLAAKTVAITGCGPIGLFAIAVARACGAAQVIAIEVNEYRRNIAREMKADLVLDPATGTCAPLCASTRMAMAWTYCWRWPEHKDAVRLALTFCAREAASVCSAFHRAPWNWTWRVTSSSRARPCWASTDARVRDLVPDDRTAEGRKTGPASGDYQRLPISEFSKGMELLNSGKASRFCSSQMAWITRSKRIPMTAPASIRSHFFPMN